MLTQVVEDLPKEETTIASIARKQSSRFQGPENRIMGVGRDEEGGRASLDQSRDGLNRLGQAHGHKRQSPDPNGINRKILSPRRHHLAFWA